MDARPVFVLITADTCPGCVAFKRNTWESLKEQLEKDGKVQIVTIEVPTTTSKPDTEKYHKDLPRFIGWFPNMILFPADRWNNFNSELIGIVKNGKLVPPGTSSDGKFIPEHIEMVGKIDMSKDSILQWVDYTISKEKMFARKEHVNNNTNSNNQNSNNQNRILNNKFPDGNLMVPTFKTYEKFRPSKVD